ncbi:adenylate/guanylate cyclase domain-containing protein [filamentous cyanobacterium CCT1]|nr:adenylate/guanylate cyclase domain-containing protein [filamentous cyanobacterium CCT1]PSN78895.1 adenylate/guanylate cyclase domain-containing protein [filamentous cyanobacterium CCP4]
MAELESIERSLRELVPADLYAALWVDPSAQSLSKVFDHLRTLQHVLIGYVPRDVSQRPPTRSQVRHRWHQGTLLFTDLAGFTPLFAANAAAGPAGAEALLTIINRYFAQMVELISKAGGNLLEFTGDAMLVQFRHEAYQSDGSAELLQAVYAGLRMQRAMANFANLETAQGPLSLQMRLGIHPGSFVAADIGTPMRRAHVLLGQTVLKAKQTEAAGTVGRVCLSQAGCDRLQTNPLLRLEPKTGGGSLVIDDLSAEILGEYDLTLNRRRAAGPVLFDRSVPGLMQEIEASLQTLEPLTSYLPRSVLQLLVNTAAARRIPPAFPTAAVAFVNLIGLPEAVNADYPDDTEGIVSCFSQAFALINGAVERRRGILQKVTYHSIGSDMLIHFGVLTPETDAPQRAAETLLDIRDLVSNLHAPTRHGQLMPLTCRMGLTYGQVFAAEIGEPRGRREFNVLGDTVNTAARLMGCATHDQILLDAATYQALAADSTYDCRFLGMLSLKGKAKPQEVYSLASRL